VIVCLPQLKVALPRDTSARPASASSLWRRLCPGWRAAPASAPEQRHILSPLRQPNPRSRRLLPLRFGASRITVVSAAGTVVAAAVLATGLAIGAAFITDHSATPAQAGQFGIGADLGRAAEPSQSGVTQTAQLVHLMRARFQAAEQALVARKAIAALRAAKPAAAERRAAGTQNRYVTAAAPSGSPQHIAMAMLAAFGWSSSQFACLNSLWTRESGWNLYATNPSSGAYGIPQALPGSKMASAGADWATDATTQIRWGLRYIQATYGSPCGAWSHEMADGWY
jgi:hypothetical protein